MTGLADVYSISTLTIFQPLRIKGSGIRQAYSLDKMPVGDRVHSHTHTDTHTHALGDSEMPISLPEREHANTAHTKWG